MVDEVQVYSQEGLGIDASLGLDFPPRIEEALEGLVSERDYVVIGLPSFVAERINLPRLRVRKENGFGLDSGFYFGEEEIIRVLKEAKSFGEDDGD